MRTDFSLRIGTASGTLLSVAPNLLSADIARTIILAAVGATVSFIVSYVLNLIFRRKKE